MKRTFPVAGFYIEDPAPPTTPFEALQRAGPGEPEVSTMEQSHSLDQIIATAMEELTDTERAVAVAAFVEGLSVRQIAELTGVSKSEIHRKLPVLKERLAKSLIKHEEITRYVAGPNRGE